MLKQLFSGRNRSTLCTKPINKKSKNPYASRGLDKFSSLVADLNDKRQRIYEQTNNCSDDDIYVWFSFSGSNDCKPVVLKSKNKQNQNERKKSQHKSETNGLRQWSLIRLLASLILILMLLIMFGRSGAVILITVGWYMVPSSTSDLKSMTKQRLNNKRAKDGTSESKRDDIRKS